MRKLLGLIFLVLPCWSLAAENTVLIPEGKYQSFFIEIANKEVVVPSFRMDKYPVTNENLNQFLLENPKYRKSKISPIYADSQYLKNWLSDLLSESEKLKIGKQPVTNISWFIARKYCQSKGQRLPTIAEWEYAADGSNPETIHLLLDWYSKTGDHSLSAVGQKKANKFGLYDMHGLIWEWVEDFNSVMISSDSRSKGDRTNGLYCGGGSVSAKDAKDYATFMRYGFRSGLRGNYCVNSLGFRCASSTLKGD